MSSQRSDPHGTRGTLFPTPHPAPPPRLRRVQNCAYPVVGAPVIQTHPKGSGWTGSGARGPPTVVRATPAPRPRFPVPPAAALPCPGGRSGVRRGGSPRGGPTSARTWLRRGDPSGAAPKPAGAREQLEPRPLRCRGWGRGAAAPPQAAAGAGGSWRGCWAVPPLGPARAAGAGERGGGAVSQPKGARGPGPACAARPGPLPRRGPRASAPAPAARAPATTRARRAGSVVATPGDGGRPGPPPRAAPPRAAWLAAPLPRASPGTRKSFNFVQPGPRGAIIPNAAASRPGVFYVKRIQKSRGRRRGTAFAEPRKTLCLGDAAAICLPGHLPLGPTALPAREGFGVGGRGVKAHRSDESGRRRQPPGTPRNPVII